MQNENTLAKYGFRFQSGSTLTKRTLMINELIQMLAGVQDKNSSREEYRIFVVENNGLFKKTLNNRRYSYSYLKSLYGLDPELLLFKAFRLFHEREPESLLSLAILMAYSRDTLIRESIGYIFSLSANEIPDKTKFELYMDKQISGKFSEKMLQSLVRNLLSAWTQSGHLMGKMTKRRSLICKGSPAAVSFALLLGYLSGNRGLSLFNTEYTKLLDCSVEKMIELADQASRRGWIVMKRIGDIIEILFPQFIQDMGGSDEPR